MCRDYNKPLIRIPTNQRIMRCNRVVFLQADGDLSFDGNA